MNVVVVESPAKAKTINKYLGSQYTVLASFGHVRDLPPKDGSVKPDEDFEMAWEVDSQSAKRVKAIADAVKEAGIGKFVYVGVSSDLANGPAKFVLGDYFKGKAEAEAAVAKDFGDAALVIKPAIIAGAPPGEIRPPGPPGLAPVTVEAVAKAAVAGALGQKTGKLDGNDAITAAAK